MILEHATFRFNKDQSRTQALDVLKEIDTFLKRRPGFICRQIAYIADHDLWVDLVWWTDISSAKAAAERFLGDVRSTRFLDRLDRTSVNLSHADVIHRYTEAK